MAAATKSILTVTSLAFALMFGGGVYVMMNLGSIAQRVSERIASDTLGVNVQIASIEVNIPEKSVTVKNVRAGNPAGYSGPYSATIDTIYMKANSFSEALLNFQDVKVSGTEMYLEVTPQGTNLTDIKKRVDEKAAQGDKAAAQIKVIIENMRIESLRVNPKVLLVVAQEMEPIVVPDIVLNGIGRKENGILAREAIAQIWADVIKRVSREANKAGYYEGVSPEALEEFGVGQIEVIKEKFKQDIDKHLGNDLQRVFED